MAHVTPPRWTPPSTAPWHDEAARPVLVVADLKSPGLAAFRPLGFPGAGHSSCERIRRGFAILGLLAGAVAAMFALMCIALVLVASRASTLLVVLTGLAAVLPVLTLHVWAAVDAHRVAREHDERTLATSRYSR